MVGGCPNTHYRYPTIEHIVPLSFGGTNEHWNLTLACYTCNHMRANLVCKMQANKFINMNRFPKFLLKGIIFLEGKPHFVDRHPHGGGTTAENRNKHMTHQPRIKIFYATNPEKLEALVNDFLHQLSQGVNCAPTLQFSTSPMMGTGAGMVEYSVMITYWVTA